jgi:hypothetical protein
MDARPVVAEFADSFVTPGMQHFQRASFAPLFALFKFEQALQI